MARNPRESSPHGYFVTLEGPEGGGKTTQAERLLKTILGAGRDAVLVREPGATPAGEQIRRLLLEADPIRVPISPRTDALLFNAARAELVSEVILPALAGGQIVLSCRFADSTLAYQGYGMGLPLGNLRGLEGFATQGLRPDLTILLDVPVEVGLARKRGIEETRFEASFDVEFHRRVRDGFRALAAAEPARFVVVDAVRETSAVFADVVKAVERVVGPLERSAARAGERSLLSFELPGAIGNERLAADRVAAAVASLGLEPARLERLKTAVSEAAMNAIEYGSAGSPDVPVTIEVGLTDHELLVRISDRALGGRYLTDEAEEPDIEAKLAGRQKARGWGLFLIRHMVDQMEVAPSNGGQTVTLTLDL